MGGFHVLISKILFLSVSTVSSNAMFSLMSILFRSGFYPVPTGCKTYCQHSGSKQCAGTGRNSFYTSPVPICCCYHPSTRSHPPHKSAGVTASTSGPPFSLHFLFPYCAVLKYYSVIWQRKGR